MQDWIFDNPHRFLETMRTETILKAGDFTTCMTCEQQPWFSFFFDGTMNNKRLDLPKKKMSNIARLFDGHLEERPLIVKLYYPGVGTPLDASDPKWLDKIRDSEILGGGAGLGADARLRKAESDLADRLKFNHKVNRIDVAVFGFSRGAALGRAFVNRILKQCEFKDGVPHWPCDTALDGKSAPLHFRFLGLFDTVESIGLPGRNLHPEILPHVPEHVERCLHIVSGHELRGFFPLTMARNDTANVEQIVLPGVHADIGGGYRPGEQGRSDLLARIPLNQMRLRGRIAGVPFTAPKFASSDVHELFEYSEDLKSLFDEYMSEVGTHDTMGQQVFAHMRLYYGWLKARYQTHPCDLYDGVCAADPEIEEQLRRIRRTHASLDRDADTLTYRKYLTDLWHTDSNEYRRTVTSNYRSEINSPPKTTDTEVAYLEAWLNPPTLSANLVRFFDEYVHDSRAAFMSIGNGGYLMPRRVIQPYARPLPDNPVQHTAALTPPSTSTQPMRQFADTGSD